MCKIPSEQLTYRKLNCWGVCVFSKSHLVKLLLYYVKRSSGFFAGDIFYKNYKVINYYINV